MEHGERHQECIRQVHMTDPGPPGVSVNYSPFLFSGRLWTQDKQPHTRRVYIAIHTPTGQQRGA